MAPPDGRSAGACIVDNVIAELVSGKKRLTGDHYGQDCSASLARVL